MQSQTVQKVVPPAITIKRIKNEFEQIQKNPPANWRVVKNDQYNWTVWMDADDFSPFDGIPIKVIVKFPDNYPHAKPIITFANPNIFYHANINPKNGNICHKIVQSTQMIDIRQRIEGLRNLLATPNYQSCYNIQAGKVYQEDQKNSTSNWHKKALRIFRGWQKM